MRSCSMHAQRIDVDCLLHINGQRLTWPQRKGYENAMRTNQRRGWEVRGICVQPIASAGLYGLPASVYCPMRLPDWRR